MYEDNEQRLKKNSRSGREGSHVWFFAEGFGKKTVFLFP
jgi:hypothetical protein